MARIEAAARDRGQSPHAFMMEAIERATQRVEQRRDFVASALEARADFARTGAGHGAADVHAYFTARARKRRP